MNVATDNGVVFRDPAAEKKKKHDEIMNNKNLNIWQKKHLLGEMDTAESKPAAKAPQQPLKQPVAGSKPKIVKPANPFTYLNGPMGPPPRPNATLAPAASQPKAGTPTENPKPPILQANPYQSREQSILNDKSLNAHQKRYLLDELEAKYSNSSAAAPAPAPTVTVPYGLAGGDRQKAQDIANNDSMPVSQKKALMGHYEQKAKDALKVSRYNQLLQEIVKDDSLTPDQKKRKTGQLDARFFPGPSAGTAAPETAKPQQSIASAKDAPSNQADEKTWLTKLLEGDYLGATTGLVGSMVSAPQSLYLNGLYNIEAALAGKPLKYTYNMDGRKYTDATAQLFGQEKGMISQAYDVNPALGTAADVAYNMFSDPTALIGGAKPNSALKSVPGEKLPVNLGTGQPAMGRPVEGTGDVLKDANYAQSTYRPSFSIEGQSIYSDIAGVPIKTTDDLASAMRKGLMKPSDVPIDYIVRDGNVLILNTRSSHALTQAGIPRSQWNAVNRTGVDMYESMLTNQLKNNGLTSAGTPTARMTGGH